ncbi:MAG: right-handed parallel beta-helix repeat-containing protein [Candidatus Brennerbacteria bacterium]|nr:right-handed parallel beta-helix repeat-containing protein [Candidatus Brennerbacteria bacterium]
MKQQAKIIIINILILLGVFGIAKASLAAPVILYTDILSGPNSGGENNKGIYLSIFGKNFGISGPGSMVKVYINDIEVDNYRSLGPSRGRQDIQQITVQIGALGNPTPGVALPIKVVVNGVASNTDKTFTVNPGTIYFVSLSGDDATGVPGDIASPYRTVQKPGINNNSNSGCLVAFGDQPVTTAGVWGLVHPGDFIVMRGGEWTDVGRDDFFLRVQNKSGNITTGAVGTGPITLIGYPSENVFINRTNLLDNQSGGGISSADSARQALGCGARVTLANLKVESGFYDGMITTQKGVDNPNGSYWRVVNNEMTAVSCQNNTKCKGGGVSGSGLGEFWVGNYVHDVYDKPDGVTNNENHGFYIDGSGTFEIAYNRIENIYGGNGIQTYGPYTPINNVSIHHNVINGTSKHGLNIGDSSGTGFVIYNNLVYNTDVAGLRFNTAGLSGAKIYNNTFFKTDRLNIGGIRAALMNDAFLGIGALDMRNNIIIPGSASHEYVGGSVDFSGSIGTFSNNLWFNGTGGTIVGSDDQNGDPKFVSIVSGAEDFHLQAGGAAQDAGTAAVASLVTDDFDLTNSRPQGAAFDIGAYEYITQSPDTTPPVAPTGLAVN